MNADEFFEFLMDASGGDFISAAFALEDGEYLSTLDVSQEVVEEVSNMLRSEFVNLALHLQTGDFHVLNHDDFDD
jgi:hypothetical protein